MNPALEKRIKRQVIGKPHRFLAVVPLGFEDTLVQELKSIGIETVNEITVSSDGKVEFTAKITEAWTAVAYSRIVNRILMHIADFKAENFRELEKKASEIPWELYLPCHPERSNASCEVEGSISIHVTCKHSRLYHSDAVAERLQKNIEGRSGNIFVTLIDDRCTIWLDLAGEELYKRGHERFVNDAPLKETIAAAMLFEAIEMANAPQVALFDPMAGSGTFSLEATYIANKLIPGICRDFALKHQPAFKEATWNFIVNAKDKGRDETRNIISKIITSDISERAVEIIKHNVECCPLASANSNGSSPTVFPQLRDFFSYTAAEIADACTGGSAPIVVLNPPYGKRLDFDAPKLYKKIGRKLSELSRELKSFSRNLTVAIVAPKDDTRPGAQYTCTANLLHECPELSPENNPAAKLIVTSHGGLTLNTFIAKI